jgi:cyclic beta-1,2-glucan synthetase
MESLVDRLVREEDRLLLLFAPPFDRTDRDPGYIKGYPPGIRENGGQYTHAAMWAVWAFAKLGEGDRAEALFRMLNPIYYSDEPEKLRRYRTEPYAVAADVYSIAPHTGRGGWSWYTGAAAWMYRVGTEAILGLRRLGPSLEISPSIPKDWPGFEVTYRYGAATYRIRAENPERVNGGVKRITLDGEPLPEAAVPLVDDGGVHQVLLSLGKS